MDSQRGVLCSLELVAGLDQDLVLGLLLAAVDAVSHESQNGSLRLLA